MSYRSQLGCPFSVVLGIPLLFSPLQCAGQSTVSDTTPSRDSLNTQTIPQENFRSEQQSSFRAATSSERSALNQNSLFHPLLKTSALLTGSIESDGRSAGNFTIYIGKSGHAVIHTMQTGQLSDTYEVLPNHHATFISGTKARVSDYVARASLERFLVPYMHVWPSCDSTCDLTVGSLTTHAGTTPVYELKPNARFDGARPLTDQERQPLRLGFSADTGALSFAEKTVLDGVTNVHGSTWTFAYSGYKAFDGLMMPTLVEEFHAYRPYRKYLITSVQFDIPDTFKNK